jgi:hypothetical protein
MNAGVRRYNGFIACKALSERKTKKTLERKLLRQIQALMCLVRKDKEKKNWKQ